LMQAEFELLMPKTLSEALAMLAPAAARGLAEGAPPVTPIAGGTNVIPDLRGGRHRPAALMDISALAALRGIRHEAGPDGGSQGGPQSGGYIVIGGGTTVATLLHDPLIAQHAAALHQAAAVFASPLVRNRATVAGNLADASPAADTAPPLLVLDAEVELTSQTGTRYVPVDAFMVGVRKTVRRPDELITAVRFPVPSANSASAFHKVGLRKADAISVLSVAVLIERGAAGICRKARIALGSVAATPIRARAAEDRLTGHPLTSALIQEVAKLAAEAAHPIDDLRGSATYRKRVVEVVVRRLLGKVGAN